MVYATDTHSSQFRIELNVNFVWEFLQRKGYKNYTNLPVAKIAESTEDELNVTNILRQNKICVHDILRKHIAAAYKKCEKM